MMHLENVSTDKEMITFNTVIDGRWKVEQLLGEGSFGTVYRVEDLHNSHFTYAMKIEKNLYPFVIHDERSKPFDMEVYVMKNMRNKNCQHCPTYKSYGTDRNSHNYVVMELVGKNLAHIQNRLPGHRFSLGTCLHIGRQSLVAIEELHRAGFLHRDIKPPNFAIGRRDPKKLYLLDFGCCREYLTPLGEHKPHRVHVLFRGTPRYASHHVLRGGDWGRVDDMWSWFFSIIELTTGRLPWDNDENSPLDQKFYISWLADKKRRLLQDPSRLLADCPAEYTEIYNHLISLKYEDKPKYRFCFKILNDVAERNGFLNKQNLDWEKTQDL